MSGRSVRQPTGNLFTHRSQQVFAIGKSVGINGRVEGHRGRARADTETSLGHHFVGTGNRYWNNRNTAFEREVKRTFLERQQVAIGGTGAFHKNCEIESTSQYLGGSS